MLSHQREEATPALESSSPHSRTTVPSTTHCLFPQSWKVGLPPAPNPQALSTPSPPQGALTRVVVSKGKYTRMGEASWQGESMGLGCFVLSLLSAPCGCQGQTYNPTIQVRPPRGSPPRQRRHAGHCPPESNTQHWVLPSPEEEFDPTGHAPFTPVPAICPLSHAHH